MRILPHLYMFFIRSMITKIPKSTSPKSTSPKSTSPQSTSPKTISSKSTSPKTISSKSTSPKSTSPKSKTLNKNKSVFIGIRRKFGDDIYENIMTHLKKKQWNIGKEFEKQRESPNYDPYNPQYIWNAEEVEYEINRLTNKNETDSKTYNDTMREIVSSISNLDQYESDEDDEENDDFFKIISKMRKRIYNIFTKCAEIRPYNKKTLEFLFKEASYEYIPIIEFITTFIKPEYCKSYDMYMYDFLKGYISLFTRFPKWCDRKNQRVLFHLNLKKDDIRLINILIDKIDEITKRFAQNNFKNIKNKREFINSYFQDIPSQNYRNFYDNDIDMTRLFMGNENTKTFIQRIGMNHFTKDQKTSMNYVFPTILLGSNVHHVLSGHYNLPGNNVWAVSDRNTEVKLIRVT